MDGPLILLVLLTLAGTLASALALTPLARVLALRLGVVDRPDGKRKLQQSPIRCSAAPQFVWELPAALVCWRAGLAVDGQHVAGCLRHQPGSALPFGRV